MSLRELTSEELLFVFGGEGEGNGGDSGGTGSSGGGDGNGNGASGGGVGSGGGTSSAGGYGFGPATNVGLASLDMDQSMSFSIARDIAVNIGIEIGKAALNYAYDHSSPYGQSQNGKAGLTPGGQPMGNDPMGQGPQDGYGVDGQATSEAHDTGG